MGYFICLPLGPSYVLEWPESVSHRVTEIASRNPNLGAIKDDSGHSPTYEKMQHRV